MSMQINSIAMAQAGAKRIFELLDQEKEVDEGTISYREFGSTETKTVSKEEFIKYLEERIEEKR